MLQDIDAWEVDEEVVVDRRSGQTGLVKYLLLHPPGAPAPSLREAFARAYGARLYVTNRVLREAATSDEYGPAAAYAGGYRAAPKVGTVDELWFDNAAWAEEFFADPAVLAPLRDGAGGRVEGYRVTEAIGVDKR